MVRREVGQKRCFVGSEIIPVPVEDARQVDRAVGPVDADLSDATLTGNDATNGSGQAAGKVVIEN